jgi:membrane fusion protein (multidrug efflux system)
MGKTTKQVATLICLIALLVLIPSCENRGGDSQGKNPGTASGMKGEAGRQLADRGTTALPVKAGAVVKRAISEFLITNTTVEAERIIDVLAKASGPVVQVSVEEGDWVSAGAVLARLDQKEIKLELREVTLEWEERNRDFERIAELRKSNIVSEEEFNTQKYQLEVSKIRLEQIQLKLENTEILAPIDGVVTHRFISTGDSINTNQVVFTVGDFNPLLAKIYIPEKEIGKVKIGQKVAIKAESAREEEFNGTVKRISPIVDAASGTVKITVEISSPSRSLKPGMFISVYLAVATHENALVVPKKALVLEKEQEVVYLAREGKAVRVPVSLGLSDTDSVEVTSGLKEGDVIVVVGQESLQDGSAIRLVGESDVARAEVASSSPAQGDPGSGIQSQGDGFDIGQLPPDARKRLEERLLGNARVKEEYERRLKEDPELARNDRKRIEFFNEMMKKYPREQ